MAKIKEPQTASATLDILSKSFLRNTDIAKLACCGTTKAGVIANEIRKLAKERNYYIPFGLLPTELVIDYLKINTSYLKKIHGIERSLNNDKENSKCTL